MQHFLFLHARNPENTTQYRNRICPNKLSNSYSSFINLGHCISHYFKAIFVINAINATLQELITFKQEYYVGISHSSAHSAKRIVLKLEAANDVDDTH